MGNRGNSSHQDHSKGSGGKYAVAPYNFVGGKYKVLASESLPDRSIYDCERFSGWLDVEYEALTPIYTRAAKHANSVMYNSSPVEFFHYGDFEPILPGSGLRGMFRSVYEVATKSRMEFVSKRKLFYRTFASAQATGLAEYYNENFNADCLVAGVIVENNGGWALRVSQAHSGKGFVALPFSEGKNYRNYINTFHPVTFRTCGNVTLCSAKGERTRRSISVPKATLKDGNQDGLLVIPGNTVGKRRYWQIVDTSSDKTSLYEIPEEVREDYRAWYENNHSKSQKPRELKVGEPAFAIVAKDGSNKIEAIGANMMMALRYPYSIEETVRRLYENDSDLPEIDMAQAVFGTVAEGKAKDARVQAVKSRVFIEDAQKVPGTGGWLNPPECFPDPLLGPKPTSIQTYLEQGACKELVHWGDPSAMVRGAKFYWHRSNDAAERCLHPKEVANNESVQTKIKPVKAGTKFFGRIRFENLTKAELGALLFIVNLDQGLAHKFGMGKSLGLGSLKTQVTDVKVFTKERFESLEPDAGLADLDITDLINAYQNRVFETQIGSPWNDDRMRVLRHLLTVPKDSERDEQSRMVSLKDDSRQWKDRLVLPKALDVFSDNGSRGNASSNQVAPPRPSSLASASNKPNMPKSPGGHNADALIPQSSKPKEPKYKVNDKVQVMPTTAREGTLDNGAKVRILNLGNNPVNVKVKLKIKELNNDGSIKSVSV